MNSPLKSKPLRNPGQSLDEQLSELAIDALYFMLMAIMFSMYAFMEWYRLWTGVGPMPKTWSLMAAVAIFVAIYKVRPMITEAKNKKLGRDGEKAVGQFLEDLRQQGATVYHDIRGENFNIDHVVISPKGIYVIETKTWTKPEKGKANIEFDGSIFKKNGLLIDPSPTIQASACAKYLGELLLQSTGRDFPVQPIVTFPGWFVDQTTPFKAYEPWVLNPKSIATFIQNSKTTLPQSDVKLASYHLSRHIRVS